MEDREYDFIVFGASGFTGQYVALEVAKTYKEDGKTWAVAGRSSQKLEKVLNNIKTEIGKQTNSGPPWPAPSSKKNWTIEGCLCSGPANAQQQKGDLKYVD